jgi:hypothetical protein
MNETTAFRYLGVTDDCTTCEHCGRSDLKSTVVLQILDADGNPESVAYYGSHCAATALKIRGGSRAVLAAATSARQQTLTRAAEARNALGFYGLPWTGSPEPKALAAAVMQYIDVHRHASWAASKTIDDWKGMAAEMLQRHQATIRDADILGA